MEGESAAQERLSGCAKQRHLDFPGHDEEPLAGSGRVAAGVKLTLDSSGAQGSGLEGPTATPDPLSHADTCVAVPQPFSHDAVR